MGFIDNSAVLAKQSTYTQTYSTAVATVANNTSAAVATTAATNVAPYGYAQAQADAIVTAVNALQADVDNVKKVVNKIIDDLQANNLVG